MDRIEFDPEELKVAAQWHGGQSSMLYAISSTGALARGTVRPVDGHHEPMTDDQWLAHLASELEDEATSCADMAEDPDDVEALTRIAVKCRDAISSLNGGA